MSVYKIDKLMEQTRKLAVEFYQTTQQVLPVSSELAKYDACQLLALNSVDEVKEGVDALDEKGRRVQIKSRVLFKDDHRGYRIGQINFNGSWDDVVLVLMNSEYEPAEIYRATREVIEEALKEKTNAKREKRGILSVAKFKVISERVWER